MELKLLIIKQQHNDWCPGCGDFGILNAQMVLSEMQIPDIKLFFRNRLF